MTDNVQLITPKNPITQPATSSRVARRLDLEEPTLPENPWVSLFAQNRTSLNGMHLSYIPPDFVNWVPTVQLDTEELAKNTEVWNNALIVYVIGETPPFSYMENYIGKYWNSAAKPELFLYDDGFFIVKFLTQADRDEIVCARPYTYNNRPIIMKAWELDFDLQVEFMRFLPLWVKFPGLPLNCWGPITIE